MRNSTLEGLRDPNDGRYDDWSLVQRGPDAAARLADAAAHFDPEGDLHLVGIFGARGQVGNLPWSTADGDFSNTGTTGRLDVDRPLAEGETTEAFIARERNENPRLHELTSAALDVLEEDQNGFWLMIEGGDIDWAMHDNSIDDAVGAVIEFDRAVLKVTDWIENHGGFEENLLIVTADHDHYLTLNEDYPELADTQGLAALTPNDQTSDPAGNGHFWGPIPGNQFGWNNHTKIPVPVYYQGPETVTAQVKDSVGQGFVAYGQAIPGVDGMLDQVHIHQAMSRAFSEGQVKNIILMIGDGMGWETTRAAAIANQLQVAIRPETERHTFQQGINGYAGTADTMLRESTPLTDLSLVPTVGVVQANPAAGNGESHGLIRFDGIFGDGPHQLPRDARIVAASLQLQVVNAGDGFTLNRMNQAWSDANTWDSSADGIQADGVEANSVADAVTAAGTAGTLTIDVTGSLQTWQSAPMSNLGWALLPTGTDGVVFHSAEGAVKPILVVEVESSAAAVPTAAFVDVTPDPRVQDVNQITIGFSKPVSGFDLSDIEMTNNGGVIPLPTTATLTTLDNVSWTIDNLGAASDQPGLYELTIRAAGSGIADNDGHRLAQNVETTWQDIRQAGDTNLDRLFDQRDVIQVLQAGDSYLSGRAASWGQGDWNGDGVFDQFDIVAAMQTGNYLQGPYAAMSS